jgi:hypothetical protein
MLKNSKLWAMWTRLSRTEQRELERWLAYDTVRDDVRRLYALLVAVRDTTEMAEDKAAIFVYLYADAPYNDNWLRQAFSFMTKHIERFVVHRSTETNTALAQHLLALAQHKRKYDAGFEHTFQQWQQTLTNAPRDAETLHAHVEAEQEWLRYQTQFRTENNNLQRLLEAEEKAFAARKLRTVCTAISYQNVYKMAFDTGILPELLAHIEARDWHNTEPAIGAYYYAYRMLTNVEGLPFFIVLVGKLPDYQPVFAAEDYKALYLSVVNFAIQEINRFGISKHGDEFLQKLFVLYKNGVAKGILLDEKRQLPPFTYKNIVAIGLRLGATTEVRSFLEDYRTALPAADRKSYYQYNLARFYFATQNYDEATPLLLQLSGNYLFLLLDTKLMLLKIYYETNDYDLLDAHLSSFKQFLNRKRHKIGYHQANYKNIIDLTQKLVTLNRVDKQAVVVLQKEIESINPLTERDWLLAQL